jgi:hypothetical protein
MTFAPSSHRTAGPLGPARARAVGPRDALVEWDRTVRPAVAGLRMDADR